MGRNDIGHNYTGHNLIGHDYIGHSYVPGSEPPTTAQLECLAGHGGRRFRIGHISAIADGVSTARVQGVLEPRGTTITTLIELL